MENAFKSFLFHCEFEKCLSPKTLKVYKIDLAQFQQFVETKFQLFAIHEIDKQVIKPYIQSLSFRKPKTIKRKIATLKALFNYLEFEEIITQNPFNKLKLKIKEPVLLPTVMSLDEVFKLLKCVYQAKNNIQNKETYAYKEKIRDLAVLELLFGTGIRVSELCNLTTQQLGEGFSSILVYGKGKKERLIQITNPEIIGSLKTYYTLFTGNIEKEGFLFINRLGKRLSEQSVRLMIKKYRLNAGLSKNITPHVFRHSFATLMLEQDVDIKYIQKMLGHSSILTTQIYTHVNNDKQKEIIRLKHPRGLISVME